MGVAAVVLAAGRGERLGHDTPKAFVPLSGRSLIERSLAVLASIDDVASLQPVVPQAWLGTPEVARLAAGPRVAPPVAGGETRQESVAAGLAVLPASIELVAIHDAARCLVAAGDVCRAIEVARRSGAAILAHPVRDTIKRVRAGRVVETPQRSECWAAETPQVFRRELLEEALGKARADGFVGTDDAQLVERLGAEVVVVASRSPNPKITWPEDLRAAEVWLAEHGA